jgi:hypothetical protein
MRPSLVEIENYIDLLGRSNVISLAAHRVFTEVTFWNSGEYRIVCRSDFTSAEIFTL